MKKFTALSATVLLAMSALAAPAYAQSYHGDRHDGRGDHYDRAGRDHDRYDRRDDRRDRDDRRWDDHDRRDDRRAYAPRVYRAPYAYVVPRGYAVERWRVGTRMPPPFYARSYYIDPYAYQLRLPPRGYRWVRVDRDAYMVSVASGIVADVLYGIFR